MDSTDASPINSGGVTLPRPSAVSYIMKNLGGQGFAREWQALSDVDKQWYRDAAEKEMDALGMSA